MCMLHLLVSTYFFTHCLLTICFIDKGNGYSLDTPVDLEIWKLIFLYAICDAAVTYDESAVGLVETK